MKKFIGILSLVLVLATFAGVLAGCGNTTSTPTTKPTTATTPTTLPPAPDADVIGKVVAVADSFLTLQVYTSASNVEDYVNLDITTLTESKDTEYAFTSSTATYSTAVGGKLNTVKRTDIAVGDMVAVVNGSDGKQQVYIYAEKVVTPEPTTPPTTVPGATA